MSMRISILLTLVAATCGYGVATAQLRGERKPRPDTAPDTTLGRSMILPARCGLRLRESTGEIRLKIEPPAARSPYMSVILFALRRGRPDSVIAPAFGVDTLPRLVPGAYRLWVRSLGYQVGDDTLRVSPGEILCVRARLVLSRLTLTPWP